MERAMTITEFRERIDQIDDKILELLSQRAQIAQKIGKEKMHQHLEIKDDKREKAIVARLISHNSGPLSDESIRKIFIQIMDECRKLQMKNE